MKKQLPKKLLAFIIMMMFSISFLYAQCKSSQTMMYKHDKSGCPPDVSFYPRSIDILAKVGLMFHAAALVNLVLSKVAIKYYKSVCPKFLLIMLSLQTKFSGGRMNSNNLF